MKIYLPFGLIAIFIALYLFYEFNRVRKAKQFNRREERLNRRKEFLDEVLKSAKKKQDQKNSP